MAEKLGTDRFFFLFFLKKSLHYVKASGSAA